MDVQEEVPACHLNPEDRIPDSIFYREMIQGMYNSSVKGLYHEDSTRPISKDCFGDWIDVEINKLDDIKNKFMDDFWSVGLTDAQFASDTIVNAWYKNMDICEFERIEDDKKNWCVAHAETCKGFGGLIDNIWESSPALFSRAADLYDLMNTDDVCYSDSEIISEVERATEDVCSIVSTVFGWDLKWDQTRQVTHIKRKDFHKKMAATGIAWGEDFALPDLSDIWYAISQIELPSVGILIQYINMIIDESTYYINQLF
jgi:hypothetical protein